MPHCKHKIDFSAVKTRNFRTLALLKTKTCYNNLVSRFSVFVYVGWSIIGNPSK